MTGVFLQAVFGRLGGYDDVNDAGRLARDPAMLWVVGGNVVNDQPASTSQMGRFETEFLATDENLAPRSDLGCSWIDRAHDRRPRKWIVLDMNSSISPTLSEQECSAWNGGFAAPATTRPSSSTVDLENSVMRPGNLHSADGWWAVREPVVVRYRGHQLRRYFRADAASAAPEIYEFLEAEDFAEKPGAPSEHFPSAEATGRPANHLWRPYANFSHQAGS